MHTVRGTGFSRECDISGDACPEHVPAASRLKPVPQEDRADSASANFDAVAEMAGVAA